jgi:hypothetical protein
MINERLSLRFITDDVSHLLAIMADPEGYRQRLQELIAQEKKTADRIAELNAMQAETLRLHQTAVATNICCRQQDQSARCARART